MLSFLLIQIVKNDSEIQSLWAFNISETPLKYKLKYMFIGKLAWNPGDEVLDDEILNTPIYKMQSMGDSFVSGLEAVDEKLLKQD